MECAQPTSWYYTYNSELDSKKSAVQTLTVLVQLSQLSSMILLLNLLDTENTMSGCQSEFLNLEQLSSTVVRYTYKFF